MSCSGRLGPLADYQAGRTLVEELVETADDIRQLATDFGLRPYRVFLVWLQWTADENGDGFVSGLEDELDDETIGVGRAQLLREIEVIPTPLVTGIGGVSADADVTGNTERGSLSVQQISMSYREDILRGLLPEYTDPEHPGQLRSGVEFFWEVRRHFPATARTPGVTKGNAYTTGTAARRRRFNLTSVPSLDPGGFQWTVTLTRADGERDANGDVVP